MYTAQSAIISYDKRLSAVNCAALPDTLLESELQVECAEQLQRPVNTAEGTRYAIDCLVRARRI